MRRDVLYRFFLCSALVSLAANQGEASGRAFTVRSYSGIPSVGSSGDREFGRGASFWFASTATGGSSIQGLLPVAVRLAQDGTVTTWTFDKEPSPGAPGVVKRDAVNGLTWLLVPLAADSKSFLYSLDTSSDAVVRWTIPFLASGFQLDPVNGAPWLTGVENVARLSGKTLTIIPISHVTGVASRIDSSRRLWLGGDDGALRFVTVDNPGVYTYGRAGVSANLLDVDPVSGSVWGVLSGQDRVLRFAPGTRVKTIFPLVATASRWAGVGLGAGGYVNLCSADGPHSFRRIHAR